jgi:hypothetical protein
VRRADNHASTVSKLEPPVQRFQSVDTT